MCYFRIEFSVYRSFRLRKFDLNSSLLSNGTNTDLSKTSTSVLLFSVISIGLCGIYYCCKKKSNDQSRKNVNRSSEDSEDSQETLEEEIFME
jgi:hypothetical protein